eukprot:jgi/Psemu1/283456/fgenesh1_pg.27_\
MADIKAERRRSLTRSRSGDLVKPTTTVVKASPPPSPPPSPRFEKIKKTKSSQSVGAVSDNTGSTEQSYTMSGEHGGPNSVSQHIPLEVVIINEDAENIPSIRGHIVDEDIERKLRDYEALIVSYKNKLKSSENLNSTLHKYLTQTQGYAENLLSERHELLDIIKDMEHEDNQRIDQELLLKFIMCTSLLLYFLVSTATCRGSRKFTPALYFHMHDFKTPSSHERRVPVDASVPVGGGGRRRRRWSCCGSIALSLSKHSSTSLGSDRMVLSKIDEQ